MARDQIDMTPIETRDELVAWLAEGCKPKAQYRIGTEYEKFAFTLEGHRPVPYEGRRSIRALLEGMQLLLGWEPIVEDGKIIGLFDVTGGGAISLEPKHQLTLSVELSLDAGLPLRQRAHRRRFPRRSYPQRHSTLALGRCVLQPRQLAGLADRLLKRRFCARERFAGRGSSRELSPLRVLGSLAGSPERTAAVTLGKYTLGTPARSLAQLT